MTGNEYLQFLAPDIQKKFLKNLEPLGGESREEYLTTHHYDCSEFISNAFIWDQTPEGSAYWQDIYDMELYGPWYKNQPYTDK